MSRSWNLHPAALESWNDQGIALASPDSHPTKRGEPSVWSLFAAYLWSCRLCLSHALCPLTLVDLFIKSFSLPSCTPPALFPPSPSTAGHRLVPHTTPTHAQASRLKSFT